MEPPGGRREPPGGRREPQARAANPQAVAPVPNGFVGMNVDGPVYPDTAPGINLAQQFPKMRAAGVQSVRAVFNWAAAQPYANWSQVPAADTAAFVNVGGIPTDFTSMDEIVGLAAQQRMSVLPVVIYAPPWDVTGQTSTIFGRPATDGPYANFVTDLVARYGPRGSFWRGRSGPSIPIRHWQIWNEPNLEVFWPAQPFAQSYVALLAAAHAAIKRADPGAQVVLAGLTNSSWVELQSIYRVRGARAAFDAVAAHPYTANPAGVITILGYVRAVMDAHGDRSKPILATEIGWPSAQGVASVGASPTLVTTEAGQARKTAAVIPLLAHARRSLNVAGFDYYTWASQQSPDGYAFSFAGLFKDIGGRLIAKPVLAAFASAAHAIER